MTTSPRPHAPLTVLGLAIRTNGPRSLRDIPELWRRVREEGLLETIPGRTGQDLYAVYTDLEDAGRSNAGWFTFLIGVPVDPATPVPDGLSLRTVPASRRAVFAAPGNDPTRIVEAWQEAWASDDEVKSFVCEYERYAADGAVTVELGLR